MQEIYVYIGGYQEKGYPSTWKFMGYGKPEKILDYAINKLVPYIKYGMDIYFKTQSKCLAYHRDLKQYNKNQILQILTR